ncbi:DUF4145 domain-containing protein [Candidatus Saccharibacteria bacterium]|nr:DUF4145 domain-containing protein [Candidatus Saccharibacteria bacterium]
MKECGPAEEKRKEFDTNLQKISPKFCEIYNEALIAEGKGLREICGIGYRKALEFLIKDYLIENNPSEKETIKKSYLGKCIKDYIDDPNIKTLAEKTAWLGNDETHFLRTYDDMDTVETMKRFINAILYFIETQLAIAEAGQIQPKKQKKS